MAFSYNYAPKKAHTLEDGWGKGDYSLWCFHNIRVSIV
uniref:Uncharacterized protein n=1 Tax=Rhizophora mucronata TaxID=61149 RepID=A0A2P2N5L5_RHIMU